jgi:hypothetical protein
MEKTPTALLAGISIMRLRREVHIGQRAEENSPLGEVLLHRKAAFGRSA